ncbi:MAG: acetyl-CoA decarbonylase/synthase complex subunit delta, partial [Pseudomonadota bacterium]
MTFQIPKQPYSGKIGKTSIGTGAAAVELGGEDCYPFYLFEGSMPDPPKIAMEVWDYDPSKEWPAAAVEPFKDVISSPEAWAKKCVEEYGADVIVLQLKSTDPNGMDRGAEEAVEVAKKVADAIDAPLVLWGTANNQKDEEVLKKISESGEGKNFALAPVVEGNHKGVGASALGYAHTIVASSPIDVNLAKQLNILLGNLGVKSNKVLVDPTTGGLGYGLEYSYSVMERIMMAALTQEDDKLQVPMINNIGNEVWKSKEAGQPIGEAPALGDPERRAILMEAVSAVCYLLGGSNLVILRHPESVRLTRSFIDRMINGGMASDVKEISKRLPLGEADLISLSPEPNLDFGEEAPPKEKAAKPEKKPAAKPAKKEEKAAAPPKPVMEPEKEAKAVVAEAEAKKRA